MLANSDDQAILVTGAAGFIGLNLLHALRQLPGPNPRVVGIDNRPLPEQVQVSLDSSGSPVTIEHADIGDAAAVLDVVDRWRPALVIHAAAMTAGPNRERTDARTIVEVNVGGTQNVLDACSAAGVERLLHVSSGAVYGPATFGSETLDESTPAQPESLYGITKHCAEQLVARHRRLHDLDAVIARLSAVYGPWEYRGGSRDFMSPMLQLVEAARRSEPIRLPADRARNWMYAPEAAAVLVALARRHRPAFGCYNVCPETTTTVSRFAQRLQTADPHVEVAMVEDPAEATISFDADPRRERAPISTRRLVNELGPGLWSEPDHAFDAYLAWMQNHPTWPPPVGRNGPRST